MVALLVPGVKLIVNESLTKGVKRSFILYQTVYNLIFYLFYFFMVD
jgi:hypothetical protein